MSENKKSIDKEKLQSPEPNSVRLTVEDLAAIKEISAVIERARPAIDRVLLINELTKQKKGVDSEVTTREFVSKQTEKSCSKESKKE